MSAVKKQPRLCNAGNLRIADALGGGSGTSLPTAVVRSMADGRSAREALSYWLALGAALVVVTAVYLLLRSRKGLALTAIRDNELASASLGTDIWRTKFFVYVVTSGLTNADFDECGGHVGVTPEFPDGIFHYHLTANEAPYSVDCYHGEAEIAAGGGRTELPHHPNRDQRRGRAKRWPCPCLQERGKGHAGLFGLGASSRAIAAARNHPGG